MRVDSMIGHWAGDTCDENDLLVGQFSAIALGGHFLRHLQYPARRCAPTLLPICVARDSAISWSIFSVETERSLESKLHSYTLLYVNQHAFLIMQVSRPCGSFKGNCPLAIHKQTKLQITFAFAIDQLYA